MAYKKATSYYSMISLDQMGNWGKHDVWDINWKTQSLGTGIIYIFSFTQMSDSWYLSARELITALSQNTNMWPLHVA